MHKVLLILGSEDLQSTLTNVLRSDYDVIYGNSANAESLLLDNRPDALVLDLFLPGADGFSILNKTRDLHPQVILLLTTLLTEDIMHTAYDYRVSYMLRKLCSIQVIADRLNKHLK